MDKLWPDFTPDEAMEVIRQVGHRSYVYSVDHSRHPHPLRKHVGHNIDLLS